jgi:hypothetical protein
MRASHPGYFLLWTNLDKTATVASTTHGKELALRKGLEKRVEPVIHPGSLKKGEA